MHIHTKHYQNQDNVSITPKVPVISLLILYSSHEKGKS